MGCFLAIAPKAEHPLSCTVALIVGLHAASLGRRIPWLSKLNSAGQRYAQGNRRRQKIEIITQDVFDEVLTSKIPGGRQRPSDSPRWRGASASARPLGAHLPAGYPPRLRSGTREELRLGLPGNVMPQVIRGARHRFNDAGAPARGGNERSWLIGRLMRQQRLHTASRCSSPFGAVLDFLVHNVPCAFPPGACR